VHSLTPADIDDLIQNAYAQLWSVEFTHITNARGCLREKHMTCSRWKVPGAAALVTALCANGALTLADPKGNIPEFGTVRANKLADLVIVKENPLQNFRTLYGTGALRLDDQTHRLERVGGSATRSRMASCMTPKNSSRRSRRWSRRKSASVACRINSIALEVHDAGKPT
jgi:hypothetical protein